MKKIQQKRICFIRKHTYDDSLDCELECGHIVVCSRHRIMNKLERGYGLSNVWCLLRDLSHDVTDHLDLAHRRFSLKCWMCEQEDLTETITL